MTDYPNTNGRGGIPWCYPVLPLSGFSVQPGCRYLSPDYFASTGSVHCGADYNGKNGGDSDLGTPIHAMADGVVVEAGNHRVWGWVIVIRHTGVGGGYGTVESQYAHAETSADVLVKPGDRVKCGQVIMRMGRGGINPSNGRHYFYSHLHCEIRTTLGIPGDDWPSTTRSRAEAERYTTETRDDPERFLQFMNATKTMDAITAPPPAPVKVAPVVVPAEALFDLATVELLDRSGSYVPLPGSDVIYQGLRMTRTGSKLRIHPEVKQ